VFCFIDGIDQSERDEHLQDMGKVVLSLLDLIKDGSVASFKMSLTSPRPTRSVREAFDVQAGTLLHMQRLPVAEDWVAPTVLQQRLAAMLQR
jgi:hypothetical protein